MSTQINGGCPFCPENGKVKVLFQNDTAYFIAVLDGQGNVMTGCYFVIPKAHILSIFDLPDDWHKAVKELLGNIPGIQEEALNTSINVKPAAGQRVGHVHMWVIMRDDDTSLPSYGLGLKALIDKVDMAIEVKE